MKAWRVTNLLLGHLILGAPAVAFIPALFATAARFGLGTALTTALLPAGVVLAPWLLWLRYTRHRPTTRRAALTWLGVAALTTAVILFSPLWFWTLPVLALLLSETLRCLTHRPLSVQSVVGPVRPTATS